VLSDTLNPMGSRKACCIPQNMPTAKRFFTALVPLQRSWTGLRSPNDLLSPRSLDFGLLIVRRSPPYLHLTVLSLSHPRDAPAEYCIISLPLQVFLTNRYLIGTVTTLTTRTLMSCNKNHIWRCCLPLGRPCLRAEGVSLHIYEDLRDVVSPDWCVGVRVELVCLFGVPGSHVLRNGCVQR